MVAALALLASVVLGREEPVVSQAPPQAATEAPLPRQELDLEKLVRARKEQPGQDLFSVPSPPVPPQAAVPAPAPAPSAPPLPFSYVGRMKKGDQTILYLLRNNEMVVVEPGRSDLGDYKLQAVSEAELQFTYLPLGTTQTLSISPSR